MDPGNTTRSGLNPLSGPSSWPCCDLTAAASDTFFSPTTEETRALRASESEAESRFRWGSSDCGGEGEE